MLTELGVPSPLPAAADVRHGREAGTGLLDNPEKPSGVTGGLSVARVGEERDSHPAIVAVLTDRWRVIDSNCGIQWILQRR